MTTRGGAAHPVRNFYIVVVVGLLLINLLLYLYAPAYIVSVFALLGGAVEVAAAYVALNGERGGGKYPRFTFHLITTGFMLLVISILWQQFLQT